MSTQIRKVAIRNIKVRSGRRSVDARNVRIIADSINKIGLKTPITVREVDGALVLVAGLHRLEAAKALGLKKIPAVQLSGTKRDARLWEDSENLHRAELTVLERANRIERWRALTGKNAKAAQVARPGGRQPKEAGINKTAKRLGFSRDEIRRAKKIATISPKTQVKARKLGLADNQAALLAIAKASTPKAQCKKLQEIVKRKNAPRRKRATHPHTGNDQAVKEAAFHAQLNQQIARNRKLKIKLAAKRKSLRRAEKALAAVSRGATLTALHVTSPSPVATHDETTVSMPSPSTAPVQPDDSDNRDISSFLDPETAFAALKAAWDNAPVVARSRFVAEVLGITGDFPGWPPGLFK